MEALESECKREKIIMQNKDRKEGEFNCSLFYPLYFI